MQNLVCNCLIFGMYMAKKQRRRNAVGKNIYFGYTKVASRKNTGDNIYPFLLYFDMLYDKSTDNEKNAFFRSFLACVESFPEEQPEKGLKKG